MRKLIVAAVAVASLITCTASANAFTYFRHKPHPTYRVHVNPVTLHRLAIATRNLALATYRLRYRMQHRYVRTPTRIRWVHTPLLSRRSG
jgi:ABC-type uncharacterized transport system auxiliary subunit